MSELIINVGVAPSFLGSQSDQCESFLHSFKDNLSEYFPEATITAEKSPWGTMDVQGADEEDQDDILEDIRVILVDTIYNDDTWWSPEEAKPSTSGETEENEMNEISEVTSEESTSEKTETNDDGHSGAAEDETIESVTGENEAAVTEVDTGETEDAGGEALGESFDYKKFLEHKNAIIFFDGENTYVFLPEDRIGLSVPADRSCYFVAKRIPKDTYSKGGYKRMFGKIGDPLNQADLSHEMARSLTAAYLSETGKTIQDIST